MSRNPGSTDAFLRMLATIAALACLMSIPATGQSGALDRPGDVFVLTNQASGNSVMVFARASDGSLSFSGSFDTGGLGMGSGPDPLGSQGSLVLTNRDHLLIGVNPGSNDISVFAVNGHQLQLLDREPSEGQMPVSVAVLMPAALGAPMPWKAALFQTLPCVTLRPAPARISKMRSGSSMM